MEQVLVTVVLPIYNVEKYLDRCIESVVNQTYRNLEILLIDDGSPDRCPQMCEAWAQKDNRIRVVHKCNAGLGEARNTGIENASGTYICFFDSDDYIHPETIEKCVTQIRNHDAETAIFGVNMVNTVGRVTASHPLAVGERVYRKDAVRSEFLPELIAPSVRPDGGKSFYMSAWSVMYSMEIITRTGWRFSSERWIVSEDVYSLLGYFAHVSSVVVVPDAMYYYCENRASLSRKYMAGRYRKIRHFYSEAQKLCKEIGYDAYICHQLAKPYIAFTTAALKQELVSPNPFWQRIREMKEIIQDQMLQEALTSIRKDRVSRNRRVLFFFMRNKCYMMCYILLRLKT